MTLACFCQSVNKDNGPSAHQLQMKHLCKDKKKGREACGVDIFLSAEYSFGALHFKHPFSLHFLFPLYTDHLPLFCFCSHFLLSLLTRGALNIPTPFKLLCLPFSQL